MLRSPRCLVDFGLMPSPTRRARSKAPSGCSPEPTREALLAELAEAREHNARLLTETHEALERHTATAEILKVIASSPSDAQPVFQAIADSAKRLVGGFDAVVQRYEGEWMHLAAQTASTPAEDAVRRAIYPMRLPPKDHVWHDLWRRQGYFEVDDTESEANEAYRLVARARGYRAYLNVQLKVGDESVGAINVTRKEPGKFAPHLVELLRTFADQAAIAIQNARLFNETQEALEQQKASAEVLGAIGKSVANTAPVFETILDACQRLFGSEEIGIFTIGDDEMVRAAAWRGPRANEARQDVTPLAESVTGRVIRERRTHHIPDLSAVPDLSPTLRDRVNRHGGASLLYAPMRVEESGLGSIVVVRWPPRAFSVREQALLQTFADQAAIAIQNARMFRQTQEALEQQKASAEILGVISQSVADPQPVFDKILESCKQLFDGDELDVLLIDDEGLLQVAAYLGEARDTIMATFPAPWEVTPAGRAIRERRVANYSDVLNNPDTPPVLRRVGKIVGYHSVAFAPMVWEDKGIGAVGVARSRGAFSEKEMVLLQSFADQAAIAIQNARLFQETQAKTRDLTEALQQQTATADVLKVISRSAFDLQTVLDTLIRSAAELVDAAYGSIHIREGSVYPQKTSFGFNPGIRNLVRQNPISPGRETLAGRVALSGSVESIPDVLEDNEFSPSLKAVIQVRSILGVPLLRDDRVEGMMILGRAEPGPFAPRQIELVRTFADQAVIAIENARLFDEVQARTRDLSEALQQQTATADVLKVISRSAFDLDTVLATLTESASKLCGATHATVHMRDGDVMRLRAESGCSPDFVTYLRNHPVPVASKTHIGRAVVTGEVVHLPDAPAAADYELGIAPRIGNFRAILGVPLVRDGRVEGVFSLARPEPTPFSPRGVELVAAFADQALIAIENVRLFDEVQARTRDLAEALHQQTATAEVLKVISRSAFDLQAVLDTLVRSASELCDAASGVIYLQEGQAFHLKADSGLNEDLVRYLRENPQKPGRGSGGGRVLLTGEVQNIADIHADQDYDPDLKAAATHSRALLGVPLMRNQGIFGAIVLTRPEPGLFSQRHVAIVQTFADQVVIAVENVRLFDEVQARTKELAASLDDLRRAQDRLIQSEKLASLGQLTAGIAHEIKNPLNFINNYSALSRELVDELAEAIKGDAVNETAGREADELIGAIGGNLDKIVQHGKRADSIVKNMLLHSREGSGERSTTNVNAMLEEALNLAYHGARAEKPGFNVTIVKSLDPNAGAAEVYAQEMTRVLLNLISNGFYATSKRKQGAADGAYEPTISAATRDLGPKVEIAIRDNGTGISDEVKAKMFNPFFTTKPAGEGTGLGLSLSHDIVVKQHGGAIEVSTEPNAFTEFSIVLPRGAAGL
jgi:two-component system, NtrC family, sensor kinase